VKRTELSREMIPIIDRALNNPGKGGNGELLEKRGNRETQLASEIGDLW